MVVEDPIRDAMAALDAIQKKKKTKIPNCAIIGCFRPRKFGSRYCIRDRRQELAGRLKGDTPLIGKDILNSAYELVREAKREMLLKVVSAEEINKKLLRELMALLDVDEAAAVAALKTTNKLFTPAMLFTEPFQSMRKTLKLKKCAFNNLRRKLHGIPIGFQIGKIIPEEDNITLYMTMNLTTPFSKEGERGYEVEPGCVINKGILLELFNEAFKNGFKVNMTMGPGYDKVF